MTDNELYELMIKYEKYQAEYKRRFFGTIEDPVVDGFHINDHLFFPKSWFYVYDYEFKTSLLEEALIKNVKIDKLERYKELNQKAFGPKHL